ncbi:MAG: hypothetical protein WC789_10715 [Lentisphaeria bacterium]
MTGYVGKHPGRRDRLLTGGPGEPWITRKAIAILDALPLDDWHVFEWGCGESTDYYVRRCGAGRVVSVEHDPAWAERTQVAVPGSSVRCIPLGPEYVAAVQAGSRPYDMIVIDGRMRVPCGFAALSRVRDGGIILLDNSERKRYRPLLCLLNAACSRREATSNGVWCTTLWWIDASKVEAALRDNPAPAAEGGA